MVSVLKNKRILIFLRSFEVGGAERQATMLANYLTSKKDMDVHVWAYSEKGPVVNLLDKKVEWKSVPFDIKHQNPKHKIKRKWDLIKLAFKIRALAPDLILPYTLTPNVDCNYVWKWTGAKACFWNQRDEWLNFLDKEIERKAFKNVSVFISNSKSGQEIIQRELGSFKKNVEHIPNAVILDKPANNADQWRSDLGLKKNDPVAIMIANLHDNKDHETLLRSWKIVVKNITKNTPTLLLAGRKDSKYAFLKKISRELGISDNVRFLGFTEDIAGLLSFSELGVFSSNKEGCPNGVLECMAAGLPVVATDINGVREALGDNNTGLVPPANHEKMAEKILFFLRNNQISKEVGERNRKTIDTKFTANAMSRRYEKLLTKYI